MDDQRQQKIIEILKENDSNSVPFAKTKEQLLAKGYEEKEIILALYSFPYDGKPNIPKEENPLAKWYKEHPEHAEKVAKTLLREKAKEDSHKAIAYGLASEFAPDIHSQSYYEVRFADQIGLPYFTLFFIGIALILIMIKFNIPEYLIYIYAYAVNLWALYKLVQIRKGPKK
jgi:hypothetical protein